MRIVKVKLGSRGYEIRIGRDLLGHVGTWLREKMAGDKVVIITNPVVDKLHGDLLKQGLDKSGFKPAVLLVPGGEEQKSLDTAARLYAGMQSVHAERSPQPCWRRLTAASEVKRRLTMGRSRTTSAYFISLCSS